MMERIFYGQVEMKRKLKEGILEHLHARGENSDQISADIIILRGTLFGLNFTSAIF